MSTDTIDTKALPVELMGVAEQLKAGNGFWHPCSGCYETEDGHPVGRYPHSELFGCALGGGCSECGGIGAIWDDTDYDEMARFLESEDNAADRLAALEEELAQKTHALRAANGQVEGLRADAEALEEENGRLRSGNTALIEALMDMVNQHFHRPRHDDPDVLGHMFMSANEGAIEVLLDAGMAKEVPGGYWLLWGKLAERKAARAAGGAK